MTGMDPRPAAYQLIEAAVALLLLLLFSPAETTAFLAVAAQPTPGPSDCVSELVAASSCLPHLAESRDDGKPPPPPSDQCCKFVTYTHTVAAGRPACLCHLVRRPDLFGFPVNATRVAALFSTCGTLDSVIGADNITELCLEAQVLPPLGSNRSRTLAEPGTSDAITPPPQEESWQSSESGFEFSCVPPNFCINRSASSVYPAKPALSGTFVGLSILLLLVQIGTKRP